MFNKRNNTPFSELTSRIAKFQLSLQRDNIDGALILQTTDLFYFSGTIQQSHLYIPAAGKPLLMVRKTYERAMAESELEEIVPLSSTKKILDLLQAHSLPKPKRLGMELDVLPTNLFLMYRRIFADAEIVDISTHVRELRAVKSAYETELIRQSAGLADQVADHMKTVLKEGLTEIALAGQIEAYARSLGHQGIVRMRLWGSEIFYGHLLCGASAAVPSYLASPTGGSAASPAVAQGAGFATILPFEPVMLDYVFACNGYLADHTRIFAIGALGDDLLRAHAAMCEIQSQIKNAAKAGVKAGEIYELAVALAAEAGYADNFMGTGPDRIRFVGHGIGLELDEYPFLAQGQEMRLKEGMIIAFEPKLIFPNRGVVGVENTHLVGKDGLEQLTSYPDGVMIV